MKRHILHFCILALSVIGFSCPARSQTCDDNLNEVKAALRATRNPSFVLRAGGVGGQDFIPVLRTVSHPGRSRWEVSGAAQGALARLGDPEAMNELTAELSKEPYSTMEKLALIRTEGALSLMMQYLIKNKNNPRRVKDAGDYILDPLEPALRGMTEMLERPPYLQSVPLPNQLDGWEKWWTETKSPHIISISEGLSDARASCWARLAEAGYVEGVYKLYLVLGERSLPLLRRLARLGDKAVPASSFKTVRGAAK